MCYRDLDVGSSMPRARTLYKNVRICFIVTVLILVTEIASISIRMEINHTDPKYFSLGVSLLEQSYFPIPHSPHPSKDLENEIILEVGYFNGDF